MAAEYAGYVETVPGTGERRTSKGEDTIERGLKTSMESGRDRRIEVWGSRKNSER